MFKNNQDFFNSVDNLVAELKQQGYSDLSQQLKSAKSSSTVPGELFGEIELALRQIEKSLPHLMSVKRLLSAIKAMY
jgi:hypothetical protein